MQFIMNLHHVVYIPIIVLTAVTAMAWSVTFFVRLMDGAPHPMTAQLPTAVPAPAAAQLTAKPFRPVLINGGAKGLPAYLRAAQMPLRSGVRAAQPYRASFGG
jgi:hypothetical protein